jgi:hypothetical protein
MSTSLNRLYNSLLYNNFARPHQFVLLHRFFLKFFSQKLQEVLHEPCSEFSSQICRALLEV